MSAAPRVFISYSHDSEGHRERVLELSQRLRSEGIDALIDRYVLSPIEGWPHWIERQIAKADHILVICTEAYRKRFEGDALGGVGWESYLIRTAAADGATSSKMIPVLLEDGAAQHVPLALRPMTAFYLPEQLPQLLRRLGAPPESPATPAGSLAAAAATPREIPVQLDIFEAARRDPPSRRIANFSLLGNSNFVGRSSTIAEMKATLNAPRIGGAWEPQIILGMGGIGKTQVAIEYAYRHQEQYDVLWLARAVDPSTLTLSYAELARELELTSPEVVDLQIRMQATRRWLADHDRWLLIFDDCPSVEALRPFLPPSPRGHVIVTSRNTEWHGSGRRLVLEPLAREESMELLLRASGRTDPEETDELAAVLGDRPLALSMVGALVETTGDGFAMIQRKIEAGLEAAGSPALASAPIAVSFASAMIAAQGKHPAAGPLLDVIAFMAPERIPLALLREHPSVLAPPIVAVTRDNQLLDRLIGDLARLCVLTRDGDFISIHPLLQTVARSGKSGRAAAALLGVAFPAADDLATWQRAESLLPHALAVLAEPRLDVEAPGEALALLERVAEHLRLRLDLTQAISFQRRAVAIVERLRAADTPTLAATITALAVMLRENGQAREAMAQIKRAAKIAGAPEATPADVRVVPLLRESAIMLASQGDGARAREALERALQVDRAAHGTDDHLSIAETLSLQALVAANEGTYRVAVALLEQALSIQRKRFGPEGGPIVVRTLARLGQLRREMGDLEGAREIFESALEGARTSLQGGRDPIVVVLLNDLAIVLERQGDLAGSRRLLEEALDLGRTIYGTDTGAESAVTMHNLGRVLSTAGDLAGSRRHLDRAIEVWAALPDRRDQLASMIEDRADLACASGNLAGARSDLEQAVAIQREVSGSETDPLVLRATRKFASVIRALGDLDEARSLLAHGLERIQEILGPDHPENAIYRFELGHVAEDQDLLDEARALYEQSIELGRKALGEEHTTVASAESSLAFLLTKTDRLDEALHHAGRALDIYLARLGPGHPHVGAMLIVQAEIECMRKQWVAGFELASRAVAVLASAGQAAGEARAWHTAGHALARLGRLAEAANAFQRSLGLTDSLPSRTALIELVERLGAGGESAMIVPAVAFVARLAPEWFAEHLCRNATFEQGVLDRAPSARIKLSHPYAAAAVANMEMAGLDEAFGWRLELASIKGESTAADVRVLVPIARVLGPGALELAADAVDLPFGVYLFTIRFVAKGRDVWRADVTFSSAEAANPFVAGPPVLDPQRFFGRGQLLVDIRHQLELASLALLGPRRSGKTSVLYRLRDLCKGDWLVAFADLHAFSGVDDRLLLEGICHEVAAAGGVRFGPGDPRPLEALRRAMRDAATGRVLLLLDELAVLADHPDAAFQLRAMSKWTAPMVRIVYAGTSRDLDTVSTATFRYRGSSPLNELINRELDQITHQESISLLERPVLGRYTYERTALDQLVELGAGRPFFLNLFAYLTIEVIRQEGAHVVTPAHVAAARAEAMSYLDRWFREFLRELDDDSYAALPDLIRINARLTGKHAEALRSAGITIGPRRDMRLDAIFIDWWSAGGRR
jgi:tetratricopeptide (TPR) repeat protein